MFENSYYRLGLDGGLRYELKGGGSLPLAYPRFQIEGEDSGAPAGMELTGREDLPTAVSACGAGGRTPVGPDSSWRHWSTRRRLLCGSAIPSRLRSLCG